MLERLRNGRCPTWLLGLFSLAMLAGSGISALGQDTDTASAKLAAAGVGGQYFIEFRARYAWDYGHTFIVHGRVGEPLTKASVAGLSPVGDDATAWVVGHYVPVPAETGWTDGDLEDNYISARYRVYMNKAQYDRVMVFVRQLQASKHVWSAELYNCNAFVSDIAQYMGLRVPKSTLIYPKVFINNLRQINTLPGIADNLIEQNLKEMTNPTRDGRAMKNSGIYEAYERSQKPSAAPRLNVGSAGPRSHHWSAPCHQQFSGGSCRRVKSFTTMTRNTANLGDNASRVRPRYSEHTQSRPQFRRRTSSGVRLIPL